MSYRDCRYKRIGKSFGYENKETSLTKDEALKLQNQIEAICEKENVWCGVIHEKKPDLKCIRLELSIKVESKENLKNK